MKQRVNEELKQHFRPEFLNRVDDTIVFPQLSMTEIIKIVVLLLERLDVRMADQGMKVEVTSEAKDLLAERGYDPVLCPSAASDHPARDRGHLSEKILFKEIGRGQTIKVDVKGEGKDAEFTFEGIETESLKPRRTPRRTRRLGSSGSSDPRRPRPDRSSPFSDDN